ncbi:diguanylate cyclase [Aureliella helgolandensis]|uniref:diguanylate cyclase n=1 Tax=Aureliella helgolandensis TaxID=2527968 RepID=A0A518GFQ9_9BACT|nr:diguanylate cyclase [Aureliella helgolandensis]QDV27436.1 putative diguanylate cyclase YdaM [Aureliella helgolandensis]
MAAQPNVSPSNQAQGATTPEVSPTSDAAASARGSVSGVGNTVLQTAEQIEHKLQMESRRQVLAAQQSSGLDQLVRARLGIYSGLFFALRAKHPPTAAHGLRVAMGCSKWAGWRGMSEDERGLLEVAALLHDVGKIGVPDSVLQKPTQLDGREQMMMEMNYGTAAEMLRGAGGGERLISLVRDARGEYANAHGEVSDYSLGARMLSIVDAFDSMTAEQVFRRPLSRERAVDELFGHAGTQFDPELVKEFSKLIDEVRPDLEAAVANRWLNELAPDPTPGFWESEVPVSCGAMQTLVDTLFHRRMLDSLIDAAVYLDADGQVLIWNRAAERITGRQASSLIQHQWSRELMGLHEADGKELGNEDCPLVQMLSANVVVTKRLQIKHTDGRAVQVQFTALPVFAAGKQYAGAILVARDTSTQANLEQRVESLETIATSDALTGVSNRAALDTELPKFVEEHLGTGQSGSLMICDIDHFKKINDTFGHQAGDEALVTFAGVLREGAREGDMVARFGGEEFILLCAACNISTATHRAEEIRRAVGRTPIASLKNTSVTASFGVTEIQPGDCPSTLLARADRALLSAKESGRNRVVQLGAGQGNEAGTAATESPAEKPKKRPWWHIFRPQRLPPLLETSLLASVPYEIAVQKLSGFVHDHQAEIIKSDGTLLCLKIDGQNLADKRRSTERTSTLLLNLTVVAVQFRTSRNNTYQSRTRLDVIILPYRPRDRRAPNLESQATRLLASFNSYLVAQVIDDSVRENIFESR